MSKFLLLEHPNSSPETLKKRASQYAKKLKHELEISHCDALNIIAKDNNYKNWNELIAFINDQSKGKWIQAFDTICTGLDCVRDGEGEPVLYDSKKEVLDDIQEDLDLELIEEDEFWPVEAHLYEDGRKIIFNPIVN